MRICLLFFLLFATFSTHGQFKNIVLDQQQEGERAPAEPSIAISLKDKDNIVGSAILDKVYVTKDGGKTWTKQKLTSSMGVWGDPVVISDKKGDFYYFHLSDPKGTNWQSEEILDRIVCQKSEDGGETWSDGASIGFNHPKDQDKEWAVVDLNTNDIFVTWTQFDDYGSKDPDCQSNILLSTSSNGKKWSEPVRLNQYSGDCVDDDNTAEGAMPAIGPQGNYYVAWSHDEKIYLDRSYDKGKTWLRNDIKVGNQPGGWAFTIPGVNRSNGMPVLIADNSPTQYQGMLYLNWSDQRNGEEDTDIWFMRSANGGDSWTPALRVNDDEPGKHQFLSWMALDNTTGYLYILYYDRRAHEDNQTDVYLAYSNNGGRSFENVKISETPFTPDEKYFFGDYTNIVAHEGRIAATWTRMDDGKTSIIASIIEDTELFGEKDSGKKKKKKKKKK
ncbi:exo-alpha-sialidase [Fulvivirga sp. M361]|uniref:sialidase family protein n=1 Tax=Fulvivirga sp. M361 TaxID=2594266 RepID=UPI00117A3F8B|nr:sialidase family protein [Fulvivirga sp. M361]TRX57709.1 exo-alpha-sialidase [Fulvivirga sp. M361]